MIVRSNTEREGIASRIVVRGTNWVGDTIIGIPAAKRLRALFPASHITFWVKESLAPLITLAGVADDVLCFGNHSGRALSRPFRMAPRLKAGGFHMAVLFQNAFESAFTAWLARIPVRVGYPTDLRGPFLNVRAPLPAYIRQRHQVYYYLGIVDALANRFGTVKTSVAGEPDCSLSLDAEHLRKAAGLLQSLGIHGNEPLFCLCPGSANSEAKRWPPEHFAALADLLMDRVGGAVAFIGSPDEQDLVERIRHRMTRSGSVNLAGKTDMITAMAVMSLSRMVISNDTGSAHLAVAASGTVLTIFGPTVPGATAPFGPAAHIIQGEATCAPCKHFRCPRPDHPCMRGIEPARVCERVQEILAHSTPRQTQPGK